MASLRNALLIAAIVLLACAFAQNITPTCTTTLSNCVLTYSTAVINNINSCDPYRNFNTCTSSAVSSGNCTTQDVSNDLVVRGVRAGEARCSSAIPKTSLALVVVATAISFFMKA